jgi:hypothetical protein
VRFDAVDPADPFTLVDRKRGATTKSEQVEKFRNVIRALEQNKEYRLRIEVPTKKAAGDARRLIRYAANAPSHPQIFVQIVGAP